MRTSKCFLGVSTVALILGCSTGSDNSAAQEEAASPPRSYTPEQRAAAERVMKNARELCTIGDEVVGGEPAHVVVGCGANLPEENRLGFATAIADADAVLSGRARNVYYYVGGAQFAQADPLHGVRLK